MRDARAAANDKEVESLIESVITTDYLTGNFTQALEQLELAKQACQTQAGCSPKVRARLYIAIGTVLAGGLKKVPEAKEAFSVAVKEDPTTGLLGDDFITPEVQTAFNDARAGNTASGGTVETMDAAGKRKPKKTWSGAGRAPRGWRSPEAYFYYEEARASEGRRDWLDCVDYAQASLAAENRAGTRLLSASCEERAGLWLEAYADYKTVADNGGRGGNAAAKERAQALREKIPKLVIRKPAGADNLIVKMNDVEISPDKLGGEIWVNPGQRTLKATAKVSGTDQEFYQVVDAAEFETATIDIKFQPKGTEANSAIATCLMKALKREDQLQCIGLASNGRALTIRASMEIAGYHDSDHTDVFSPAWSFGVESPTAGWGLGGSFVLDIVTAASTDIVATASPRWREVRYEPALHAHKKFPIGDISIHGSASLSPDDYGEGVGIGYSVDVAGKRLTPSLGYDFGHEDTGRSGTPLSAFNQESFTHGASAGLSIVLDKATVLAFTFNFGVLLGDISKPYRYIPTFASDPYQDPKYNSDPNKPFKGKIDQVQAARLPIRLREQLPTTLQRYALSGLLAHRFGSSTIRLEERLYTDSWGAMASTTSIAYYIDANERIRIWPQARFNIQSGTSFWQRTYLATPSNGGNTITVPSLRTGDRELGPLIGATGGLAARVTLGEERNWSIGIQGIAIYNRFLSTLYIDDRLGLLGVTTLEADFE